MTYQAYEKPTLLPDSELAGNGARFPLDNQMSDPNEDAYNEARGEELLAPSEEELTIRDFPDDPHSV